MSRLIKTRKKGQDVWCRPTPTPRSLFAPGVLNGTILLCEAREMENARRKLQPLKVYCTEKERDRIELQARTAGMSVSEYLRKVGIGEPVRSRVDKQAVKSLAKVNADLGRAGGLLKMLLKNEERLLGYTGAELKTLALSTVKDMAGIQSSLALISERILRD